MTPDHSRSPTALGAAAGRLQTEYAAAETIRALTAAGIASVLLKGPSITRWLYAPEDGRTHRDIDLLVSPAEFTAAVDVLAGLGFEAELNEDRMPPWWREHALNTVRPRDLMMVDMHRGLPGVRASDERTWVVLSGATETIVVGGLDARTLNKPGRALHAALHAAQHGGAARDLDVLSRALRVADSQTWTAACELAGALDANAAFHRGLSLLPAGRRLAAELRLTADHDIGRRAARRARARGAHARPTAGDSRSARTAGDNLAQAHPAADLHAQVVAARAQRTGGARTRLSPASVLGDAAAAAGTSSVVTGPAQLILADTVRYGCAVRRPSAPW